MNKFLIITSLLIGLPFGSNAQFKHIWSTHGVKHLIYTPGLEASYFFSPRFGIHAGGSVYFQEDDIHITNRTHRSDFNFYSANLGLGTLLHKWNNQHIGVRLGAIMYYGPNYKKLHYYEAGDYTIYTDVSHYRLNYGFDIGAYYTFGKFSILYKFDTPYKIHRFGIGYFFTPKDESILKSL